jgi:hypothetical protein
LPCPISALPLSQTILSSNVRNGIVVEEVQFESQTGIRVPGWFLRPSSGPAQYPAILYLSDDCGGATVEEPGSMDRLLEAGYAICAISPRGLGITAPRFPKAGPNYYGGEVSLEDRYSWASLALGQPILGQRVWDTIRAIDYLLTHSDVNPSQLRILGTGKVGLAAQMAAFLDSRARSLLLDQTLVSYASLLASSDYSLPLSCFLPRILRHFDLPDLNAAIAPRPCWLRNSTGPEGHILSEPSLPERYEETAGTPARLRLIVEPAADPQQCYLEWTQNT